MSECRMHGKARDVGGVLAKCDGFPVNGMGFGWNGMGSR